MEFNSFCSPSSILNAIKGGVVHTHNKTGPERNAIVNVQRFISRQGLRVYITSLINFGSFF